MPFDIEQWRGQVKDRLQAWAQAPRQALSDAGAQTLFGIISISRGGSHAAICAQASVPRTIEMIPSLE